MARTATPPSELVADAAPDAEHLLETMNLHDTASGLAEERDLVNQLLGQAQMAESFSKFSLTVSTSKLAYIKENKLYRALQGKKSADGQQLSGTWDYFCALLGRSRQQIDEDIANLRFLGEEALESMSRMGIGYRELRQYRRLPEDDKTALMEAAKAGDSGAFIDLAEELISKHSKEKADLSKRLDELDGDYSAQGEVLAKKSDELNQTRVELEKARRHVQALSADELAKELRQEVTALAFEAEAVILGKVREGFAKLAEHGEASGSDHRPFKAGMVRHLENLLAGIRDEFGLPDNHELDNNGAPAWLTENVDDLVADLAGA